MDHTKPELKYVDARDLNGTAARLDGVTVIGSDGEKLGVEDSPGFDKDEFAKLAGEDATRVDQMVAGATGAG